MLTFIKPGIEKAGRALLASGLFLTEQLLPYFVT